MLNYLSPFNVLKFHTLFFFLLCFCPALGWANPRDDARDFLDQARKCAAQKDYNCALNYLKKAQSIEPRNPGIMTFLGYVNIWEGKSFPAEQHFKQALKIKNDFVPALVALGTVYADRGDFKKGIDFLKAAVDAKPQSAKIRYLLVSMYAESGLEKAAIALLRETIAQGHPSYLFLEAAISGKFTVLQNNEEFKLLAKKALSTGPQHLSGLYDDQLIVTTSAKQ